MLLIPFLCWWSMRTEIISGGSELIEASLLEIVVFVLFVLSLFNEAVRRFLPTASLTRAELLLVYVMQTTTVGVAGLGQVQFLNQALGAAFHYTTPDNNWIEFHRFIPSWWVPDPGVLDSYYQGGSTFFTSEHIRGWIVPIGTWTLFITLMLFSFLCLNTMLRRHWVEHERLTFPLVSLPLELTQDNAVSNLLRRPSFWCPFILVCLFRSVAGIHLLFPSAPDFPGMGAKGQLIDLGGLFSGAAPPWNSIGYFAVSFHPVIVGITYFIPLDISFSAWFFYLFVKGENILSSVWGYQGSAGSGAMPPFTAEQSAGAFLAFAGVSLWGARHHLSAVWRKAFRKSPHIFDADEPISYRLAVFGFLGSVAALVAFVALGGLAWYLALGFFALYFLMIVACTRLRAEAGPMLAYGPQLNPHGLMIDLPGSRHWGANDLTPLAYLQWFDSDYRTVAMPQQMEALKISEQAPFSTRLLARWMMLGSVLAAVSAFVSVLAIYYRYGAATGMGDNAWRNANGQMPFMQLMNRLHDPLPTQLARFEWIGIGAAAVMALTKARLSLFWWPLHPAGFVLANTAWTMDWVWFPTFMGWAAKALIIRYGGIRIYRAGIPVFIGLLLGDVVISCLWSICGVLMGVRTYMFFPG